MNDLENIRVFLSGKEVGTLAYSVDKATSYFQFTPEYLELRQNAFPFILKKELLTQKFETFNNTTFRGLPPMFADSLPDDFGNTVFNQWLKSQENESFALSPIQQLAYMSNRGMGALEYYPGKIIPEYGEIGLAEIEKVLTRVLENKNKARQPSMNEAALFAIFKIGTSAGGARPKIIVAENKETGVLMPGDQQVSDEWNHYIIKLHLNDIDQDYNRSVVEYAYYLMAKDSGLDMMPSKLIDGKHFATQRFDRIQGKKIHTLTATGLTGWNFKVPDQTSYDNVFRLSLQLNVPQKDMIALYRRMVFNVVNSNIDDHLKNHSFQFAPETNKWAISPSYDLTYPLNPFQKYTRLHRAMAIGGKRNNIQTSDLLNIADKFHIKNPEDIIDKINTVSSNWSSYGETAGVSEEVMRVIQENIRPMLLNERGNGLGY